ncbi:MAG: exosortase X [Janthinobacterium lividum]
MFPQPISPLVARPSLGPARGRFLLVAAGLYALWLLVYEGFVGPDGRLDALLTEQVAQAGAWLLRALGFAARTPPGAALLYMDGLPAVIVGAACDGLALYALFAGFVLAYPGPGRVRLWFVPLGVVSLFLLNVVRVAVLALNHHYAHRSVEFNHHYTFNFVVYGCICALWVWWVRRYGHVAAPSPA